MIFTKLYPFSVFLGITTDFSYFFEYRLPNLFRYSERFASSFFLLTFLMFTMLLHRTIASPDALWNEAKLSQYAEQALTPSASIFQKLFLLNASGYATSEDVSTFIEAFHQTSSQL